MTKPKPTLAGALATKGPAQVPPAPEDTPPRKKAASSTTVTTIRIPPERLEALKILAAKRRVKVNDLLLEGAAHVLALHDKG